MVLIYFFLYKMILIYVRVCFVYIRLKCVLIIKISDFKYINMLDIFKIDIIKVLMIYKI